MPRVKRGVTKHLRHKRVLQLTKGHQGVRHRLYKRAKESLIHSLMYAYAHRRERKGDFRRLWIARINAAARQDGLQYSQLLNGLRKAGVTVNRKMMAHMAVNQPEDFSKIVTLAKEHL